ncbi:DUF4336 domain-containing protein [Shewanella sp. D64]|uniref:DUF4336 domain-containing protein n=1 Tax=unclassified Shewanella TaxID=196818 RepID=UPI0022BA1547|nr:MULTISPECIES: DUF4336 domain-containing protein [unclassified Shewanella]MEC4728298.1 DUF4336 domain-containing protein [Shewanella sp. D64]MEC4740371.1 DUF4336 domain-containing protein [Shewanella sp. E94]WBJ93330.1 DUF4336 domain-containing protein [Shewanella sp. MTB7]
MSGSNTNHTDLDLLHLVESDIWYYDGPAVSFYGMPYTTRMTVIRLKDNKLWIHSPCQLSDELQKEVDSLGEVAFLIAPNKIHYLFIQQWISQYGNARHFTAPGLIDKCPDIAFDEELTDKPVDAWSDQIKQLIFTGSPLMEEAVFFHQTNSTLILTDLIENFPDTHFKPWQNHIAKLVGILAPNGQTPADWRISFIFGKDKARGCFKKILSWQPSRIIITHGECIWHDASAFLTRSFRWLN